MGANDAHTVFTLSRNRWAKWACGRSLVYQRFSPPTYEKHDVGAGGQVGAKWDVPAWFRPLAHFGKMQVGAVFRPYSLE